MSHALTITMAQLNPIVGDLTGNLEKIRHVRDSAATDVDLIVFPEMIVCGYPPEDLVLKPFFLDRIEEAVQTLIDEDRAGDYPALLISAPWRDKDGAIYNAALLIQGGEIGAMSAKRHLPNYGVFDEARIFTAGPLPAPVPFKGVSLGIMICEDMWYDDVAAHLKEQGAEILITLNASPYEGEKNDLRLYQARLRAEETTLPLLYINQCGGQDELVFDGASFVVDKSGHLQVQLEEFVEDNLTTIWTKDGDEWLCTSQHITPVHKNEDALYQALVTGLRDYVEKNNFPGVLIGLSGGVDSALSAALAVDALGADRVHCVMMPSPYTAQDSLDDAKACAQALGTAYDIISIEDAFARVETTLAPFLKDAPPVTHENIQPRLRGLILMALSNAGGKMLLSTGNKSEMAVGYATLYGDMCGGFNALKDVYKTQVYALTRWRNQVKPDHCRGPAGLVVPENIITKAPSAELKPDQCDQDSLPPYEALDAILHDLIECDRGLEEIVAHGHDPALVRQVWHMLDRAEYKRRQAPPGVKITSRAFGRDRRYPITNHFGNIVENLD